NSQFLACLAVLGCSRWAAARPDLSRQLYSYGIGQNGQSSSGVVSTPVVTTSSSYQPTASGSAYFNSVPSVGQISYVGNSGFVPSTQVSSVSGTQYSGAQYTVGSGGSNAISDSIGLAGIQPGPAINYKEQEAYISHLVNFQPPVVTKHFYLHTAPEDHDEQQIVRYVNVGRPQKNYRVVFINAPTSTTSKAKIIANVAPVEDKTAIYVLSKKSNALDVSAEVVTQRPVNNKPEVFFIKYKTPEEAAHAQQTIQANYDALGGSSQTSDEGIVPVSSVINSLGDNGASGVLADGSGAINIVGTGGVPLVDAGSSSAQYDVDNSGSGSSNSNAQLGFGGNTVIQTNYLPPKPIRS
ncbi:TwdlX, partial [Drosophila busckii]